MKYIIIFVSVLTTLWCAQHVYGTLKKIEACDKHHGVLVQGPTGYICILQNFEDNL